jgi:hydrogenase/urease accessory protein HupE
MMFAMTIALTGALLGLRYNVLALVPAVPVGLTASILIGIARHDDLWSIILVAVVTIAALQAGYLGGAAIRWQKSSVTPLPSAQKRRPQTQRA